MPVPKVIVVKKQRELDDVFWGYILDDRSICLPRPPPKPQPKKQQRKRWFRKSRDDPNKIPPQVEEEVIENDDNLDEEAWELLYDDMDNLCHVGSCFLSDLIGNAPPKTSQNNTSSQSRDDGEEERSRNLSPVSTRDQNKNVQLSHTRLSELFRHGGKHRKSSKGQNSRDAVERKPEEKARAADNEEAAWPYEMTGLVQSSGNLIKELSQKGRDLANVVGESSGASSQPREVSS